MDGLCRGNINNKEICIKSRKLFLLEAVEKEKELTKKKKYSEYIYAKCFEAWCGLKQRWLGSSRVGQLRL
jgi:hypothetical protein